MTQFESDSRGAFSELLYAVREILLSYPSMIEVQNAKQTSYRDEYSMVAMIRSRGDRFVIAFGKGHQLQAKYPMLEGTGKIVRHLYFKSLEELNETLLREMIEESSILNMEAYEMRKMRCHQNDTQSKYHSL